MAQIFHAGKGHYLRTSSYCGETRWYLSEAEQQIFTALRYQQVKGELANTKT